MSTTDAAAGSSTTAAEPVAPTEPGATAVPTTTAKKPARGGTTTSLLPASTGLPPVLSKNSQGLDITLDETALLACAQDQIAWVALQGGQADEAATALGIAATRAEASAVADIKSSAATLRAAAASASPQAEVDRFLALCVTNGFEY